MEEYADHSTWHLVSSEGLMPPSEAFRARSQGKAHRQDQWTQRLRRELQERLAEEPVQQKKNRACRRGGVTGKEQRAEADGPVLSRPVRCSTGRANPRPAGQRDVLVLSCTAVTARISDQLGVRIQAPSARRAKLGPRASAMERSLYPAWQPSR